MSEINIDDLQAGCELDALVAEKVMGWKRVSTETAKKDPADATDFVYCVGTYGDGLHVYIRRVGAGDFDLFAPSTNIGTAMRRVVPRVRQLKTATFSLDCLNPTAGYSFDFLGPDDDYWQAMFKSDLSMNQARFDRLDYAYANTPELAICRAALKVVANAD